LFGSAIWGFERLVLHGAMHSGLLGQFYVLASSTSCPVLCLFGDVRELPARGISVLLTLFAPMSPGYRRQTQDMGFGDSTGARPSDGRQHRQILGPQNFSLIYILAQCFQVWICRLF
jgi:hypothetical protein